MNIPTSVDLASSKGGTTYTLLYADVDVAQTIVFDSINWHEGLFDNVSFTDKLQADDESGGSWQVAIPLASLLEQSKGIHLTWTGHNIAVSYATDAGYVPAINGRVVLEDIETSGLFLSIKVDLIDEESYLEQLRIDLLADRVMQPFNGNAALKFNGASMDLTPDHQIAFTDDSGALIRNGYLEIQPGEAPVKTIEMWIKIDDTDGLLLNASESQHVDIVSDSYIYSGVTAYRDGVPVVDGEQPQDQWHHYVFVLNTEISTTIRIGENLDMNVGHLAIYDYAFTLDNVVSLYRANLGIPAVTISDSTSIRVFEGTPATDIYAYIWTPTSG